MRPSSRQRWSSSYAAGLERWRKCRGTWGLADSLIRKWIETSDGHDSADKPTVLTVSEKEELSHLRREVKVLRMEREFLKNAATFFAKENV